MASYRDVDRRWERWDDSPPGRVRVEERSRSHAAIPVAAAIVLIGLFLSRYTFLASGSLGVLLFVSGFSLLSSRLNPLSPHFYLTRKPSWAAIGIVFLGGLLLLAETYALWSAGAPAWARLP